MHKGSTFSNTLINTCYFLLFCLIAVILMDVRYAESLDQDCILAKLIFWPPGNVLSEWVSEARRASQELLGLAQFGCEEELL